MKAWPLLVSGVVLIAMGIAGLLWARARRRQIESPVTDHWLASHDYGKGGDDRRAK